MTTPPPSIEPEMLELPAAPRPAWDPASVHCHTCHTCVWSGGVVTDDEYRQIEGLPFGELAAPDGSTVDLGDAQDLLTLWADQHCARDGCPHTTAGREAARARDPAVMAAQIADLHAAIARLTAQTS